MKPFSKRFGMGLMRLRYSMKALLVIFTAMCLILGLFAVRLDRARWQRRAVEALQAGGASVWYEQKYLWRHGPNVVGWSPQTFTERSEDLLAKCFGRDFVYRVDRIYCGQPASDDFVLHVKSLPYLSELQINVKRGFSDAAWATLLECNQIERLTIERDQIESPRRLTGLSKLHQLRSMTIEGGELTIDDVRDIAELTGLNELRFGLVGLTDVALQPLAKLKSLEQLHIVHRGHGKEVTDHGVAFVAKLTALRSLTIARIPTITDEVIHYFEPLTRLEALNLDSASIRGVELQRLAKLPNLRDLNLIGTPVDDDAAEQLAALKQLESLNLYGTQITDHGLESLQQLLQLREPVLSKSTVTADGVAQLQKQLPKCAISTF